MDQHFKAQQFSILAPTRMPFTRLRSVAARHQTSQRQTSQQWILRHWEWVLISAILLVAALAHGINMFHYPYFEDDEGTYMAQAWAILHQGQLAPYTYWYDHAPAGWIQIALWELLTGGSQTFGGAIQSGRVLMLLFHLGSVYLVYRIARDASGRVLPAVLAALLFTLSPYEIFFGRRVILDNICTFWLLLSIAVLIPGRLTLTRVWTSALALAISILSKEVTVFALPVMAYLVYWRADRTQRTMAVAGWITLVCSIGSLYALMAVIKGELFPTGTFLGGYAPHVSLLGSLAYQASRGKDGGLLQGTSGFWLWARIWMRDEPTLVLGGTLSMFAALLASRTHRLPGILAAIALSLWVFLARGGELNSFYILPLLPILSLTLALNLDLVVVGMRAIFRRMRLPAIRQGAVILSIVTLGVGVYTTSVGYQSSADLVLNAQGPQFAWVNTQADAQVEAATWIQKHISPRDTLVIDMSMWPSLHESHSSVYVFDHADYYWKVEQDPAIRLNVYHGTWRDIDYVVTTFQMLTDMKNNHMTIIADALAHCTVVAHFDTGGWPVSICKVANGRYTSAGSPAHRISLIPVQSARLRCPMSSAVTWRRAI